MSGETDLIKLYSARILELAADIPHHGRLEDPDATVKRRAPLCGSTVTVDIKTDGTKITDYAAEVKACALGQACLLYTSPSPRDLSTSRMPSSA